MVTFQKSSENVYTEKPVYNKHQHKVRPENWQLEKKILLQYKLIWWKRFKIGSFPQSLTIVLMWQAAGDGSDVSESLPTSEWWSNLDLFSCIYCAKLTLYSRDKTDIYEWQ